VATQGSGRKVEKLAVPQSALCQKRYPRSTGGSERRLGLTRTTHRERGDSWCVTWATQGSGLGGFFVLKRGVGVWGKNVLKEEKKKIEGTMWAQLTFGKKRGDVSLWQDNLLLGGATVCAIREGISHPTYFGPLPLCSQNGGRKGW